MILGEVEEILEVVDAKNFKAFAQPLFQQLAKSLLSPHFQVCLTCFTHLLSVFVRFATYYTCHFAVTAESPPKKHSDVFRSSCGGRMKSIEDILLLICKTLVLIFRWTFVMFSWVFVLPSSFLCLGHLTLGSVRILAYKTFGLLEHFYWFCVLPDAHTTVLLKDWRTASEIFLSCGGSTCCWKVAERVLSFWGNEYIAALISDNIAVILPILYPALFEMSKSHWNQQIVQLTQTVLRYLHDINRPLYDEVSVKYRQNLIKYVASLISVVAYL